MCVPFTVSETSDSVNRGIKPSAWNGAQAEEQREMAPHICSHTRAQPAVSGKYEHGDVLFFE